MILLVPLITTTLLVRVVAGWLVRRGRDGARSWASWPAAATAGMAAVFVSTSITHFIEPQRSGLIAIVPEFVPAGALVVTLTGIAELVLAVGLVTPRTRRWAALASVLFLIALFPANVVAAGGVDHPAAPSTALVPRTILQLVFIGFAATPLLARPHRQAGAGHEEDARTELPVPRRPRSMRDRSPS